jgi:pimeloyl-ACP methyl ester carboxylesterase
MTAPTQDAHRIELRCGALTFTAWTQGVGPLVVLLHGFPDSPHTFKHQLPALAAAGYRAVAVTSRGYEPSSMPADGSFHVRNLAQDVVDWVAALGETQAHLVGHDWGATIAYAAAALKPQTFRSLSAMAVPQPRRFGEVAMADPAQLQRMAYIMFFQQVGVAEAAIAANDFAYLRELWRQWSPGWAMSSQALDTLTQQFSQDGVPAATLAYYRQALDTTSEIAQAGTALFNMPIRVPTLGLYGAQDGCIAAEVFERAMRAEDFPAGLSVQRVADAGHFLHQEAPSAVNRHLINFLQQWRA